MRTPFSRYVRSGCGRGHAPVRARGSSARAGGASALVAILALAMPTERGAAAERMAAAQRAARDVFTSSADASRANARDRRVLRTTPLDVTGRWLLRHRVRRTSHQPYRNLELIFRVRLEQRGDRVTGTAEKWRENGRELAPAARTRLTIDGRLDGDRIVGTFVEHGARRTSRGRFEWRYSPAEGWLSGSFATTVASTTGDAVAVAIG